MPYNGAIETIQNTQNAVGGSEDTFQITFSLHAWFTRNSKSNEQCWVMAFKHLIEMTSPKHQAHHSMRCGADSSKLGRSLAPKPQRR